VAESRAQVRLEIAVDTSATSNGRAFFEGSC
jgi:hypothetical protein